MSSRHPGHRVAASKKRIRTPRRLSASSGKVRSRRWRRVAADNAAAPTNDEALVVALSGARLTRLCVPTLSLRDRAPQTDSSRRGSRRVWRSRPLPMLASRGQRRCNASLRGRCRASLIVLSSVALLAWRRGRLRRTWRGAERFLGTVGCEGIRADVASGSRWPTELFSDTDGSTGLAPPTNTKSRSRRAFRSTRPPAERSLRSTQPPGSSKSQTISLPGPNSSTCNPVFDAEGRDKSSVSSATHAASRPRSLSSRRSRSFAGSAATLRVVPGESSLERGRVASRRPLSRLRAP
jgi:hypothetical protein